MKPHQLDPRQLTYKQVALSDDMRDAMKKLYDLVADLPACRERSIALTHVEDASMWIQKTIAHACGPVFEDSKEKSGTPTDSSTPVLDIVAPVVVPAPACAVDMGFIPESSALYCTCAKHVEEAAQAMVAAAKKAAESTATD